ncbi:MAG TPA: hypothetical protein VM532_08470 [Burkholderiales bacterium]|nr:hypothetical protein [Burkholderiales bacterium]
MRGLTCIGCGAVALMLTGCVSVVPLAPPPGASPKAAARVADRLPTDGEKWATSLPNSYFGAIGASGSVGVGLLFGPLGVLANAAYVDAKNKENSVALADLTAVNLGEILKSVVGAPSPGEAEGYVLVPAGIITFKGDESYRISCVITATYAQSPNWRARYLVQPEGFYDIKDPTAKAKVVESLTSCLDGAYKLFTAHVTGAEGTYTTRTVRHPTFALRLPVQDAALPHRVIGNDGIGLMEFRKSDVVGVE